VVSADPTFLEVSVFAIAFLAESAFSESAPGLLFGELHVHEEAKTATAMSKQVIFKDFFILIVSLV